MFLMSRLIDHGILQQYLDNNCSEKDYRFCEYREQIPWDFIWDQKSPLYKTGGWEANKEEYNKIITDIFLTPEYAKLFFIRSLESGWKQFFNFETGDTPRQAGNSAPYYVIKHRFEEQMKEYLGSRQNQGKLDYRLLNDHQNTVVAISLLVLLLLLVSRTPTHLKVLIVFILFCLYVNALVCGSFSVVIPRYQSRVIWLLPLPVILSFFQEDVIGLWRQKINRILGGPLQNK